MGNTAVMQRDGRANCALRGPVVAESLADLHGPAEGLVELPQRLCWAPERVFDLADEDQTLAMYDEVLENARSEADLAEYLDGETLARLWPDIDPGPRVQRAWEARHPLLTLALLTPAA